MQKPSVGRIVHYYGADQETGVGERVPKAAIITRVWSDTCVNLCVFGFDGQPQDGLTTSVLLVQEGEAKPETTFCEWPPRV